MNASYFHRCILPFSAHALPASSQAWQFRGRHGPATDGQINDFEQGARVTSALNWKSAEANATWHASFRLEHEYRMHTASDWACCSRSERRVSDSRIAALGHHRPAGHGNHPDPQERAAVERGLPCRNRSKRNPPRHPALRPGVLEAMDWIPHSQPDRGEDAQP